MIGTSNTLKYSYIFYRKALNKRPGAYSLFAPLGWRFFEGGRGAYPGGGCGGYPGGLEGYLGEPS